MIIEASLTGIARGSMSCAALRAPADFAWSLVQGDPMQVRARAMGSRGRVSLWLGGQADAAREVLKHECARRAASVPTINDPHFTASVRIAEGRWDVVGRFKSREAHWGDRTLDFCRAVQARAPWQRRAPVTLRARGIHLRGWRSLRLRPTCSLAHARR